MKGHVAIGTFAGLATLREGLRVLQGAGFTSSTLSVLAAETAALSTGGVDGVPVVSPVTLAQEVEHTGTEEATGALVGGGVGLVLGLTALSVPGFGSSLLAAGPLVVVLEALVATTAGAGLGTLLGAILDDRGSAALCESFEAALRRGNWLLVVHGDVPATLRASELLAEAGASRVDLT